MIVKWYKEHKAQKNRERQLAQIREFCSRCPCNIGCPVSPEEVMEGKDCAYTILQSVVRI